METFRAFGGLHAATLGAIFALTALAVAFARRHPLPEAPTAAERAIGWSYLAAWVATYAFLLFPPLHDPAKTYPLQLCHLNAVAAALLLATGWRWLRPLAYSGFAPSTQPSLTLREGPVVCVLVLLTTHG
jgi:uncharacterized membrane protein YwaF